MDEIIQIKCPFDGAVLSVKNQPGIESKNVTCPVCRHRFPFTEFRRVARGCADTDPETEYPDREKRAGCACDDRNNDDTERLRENFTLGTLKLVGASASFRLKPGRNVIGRKGLKSTADFQIDTGGNRSMSREHIVVEVKKVPGRGFVHYLSLYKEKVNRTCLGAEPLAYGECVVLNHGDIIRLPDADLKFEIPDDDATDI